MDVMTDRARSFGQMGENGRLPTIVMRSTAYLLSQGNGTALFGLVLESRSKSCHVV